MSGKPRIAFIDIESSPLIIAAWQTYDTNAIWIERDTYILSFAVLWVGEGKVKSYALPDFPVFKKNVHDDGALVGELFKVLDEADIVIAHNGDRFDIPKINARLAVHGHSPPSPYKSFDTLKLARKFKFDSSKLDNLGRYLGCGRKIVTTGADLWRRCAGDKYDRKAWKKMRRYNEQDVLLLRRVYLKLRPWAQNHPDLRLYSKRVDHSQCPVCQSSHVIRRGLAVTRSRRYQQWQCKDCGKYHQGELIRELDAGSTKTKSNHLPPSAQAAQSKSKKVRNDNKRDKARL